MERKKNEARSIQEIVDVIEKKWGKNAGVNIKHEAFYKLYLEAIDWCKENDPAVQDFISREYRREEVIKFNEENFAEPLTLLELEQQWDKSRDYVRLQALRKAAEHLRKGAEKGLQGTVQMLVDTLWGSCYHDYRDNYVACAKELAPLVDKALAEECEHTNARLDVVLEEIFGKLEELTEKHKVWYDKSKYNLTMGYLGDWFCSRYNGSSFFGPVE